MISEHYEGAGWSYTLVPHVQGNQWEIQSSDEQFLELLLRKSSHFQKNDSQSIVFTGSETKLRKLLLYVTEGFMGMV